MVRHTQLPAWARGVLIGAMVAVSPTQFALSARASQPNEAVHPKSLFGFWSTQDGNGVIEIEQCGQEMCGRIVGIQRAKGEPIPKDVHGDSQCGLTIISNERPTGNGEWLGQIVDPRSGKAYGAKIWLDDDGNLRLRGFLGLPVFGQTQTWHPFTGHVTAACELT